MMKWSLDHPAIVDTIVGGPINFSKLRQSSYHRRPAAAEEEKEKVKC